MTYVSGDPAYPPGGELPGASPIEWTPDRLALRSLLGLQDADLEGLYSAAIEALTILPLSRARLTVAAHTLRELIKILPQVLGDPITPRADVNRPAKELFQSWPDGELESSTSDGDHEDSLRTVTGAVYAAARAVAQAAADGNRNARQLTAVIATGQMATQESAPLRRLHEAIEFFRRWSHVVDYSKPDRPLPALSQVMTELRIVEEALLTRLGNRADRARSVRALLRQANSRIDEETS